MRPVGRPKGQGTITAIPASPAGVKRWRIAVTMADGRRVWRTAHSPREAERIRLQLVEARERDLDPSRLTLADFLRGWVDGMTARVRPRTQAHYRTITEVHIIPKLGSLKLEAVSPRRIQAWIDADEGAPRSVAHHHAVLHAALAVAAKQRLLPYNPAAGTALPRVTSEAGDPLTIEEARTLLTATKGTRLAPLWRLALVTGMRQGELLGLSWDDVGPGTITVRSQLQRIGGKWVLGDPKAARRVERIAIDAATAALLETHRRAMAEERTPGWTHFGLVFVTPDGRPWHGADILDEWHAACRLAKIRERRFHDLRGTSATLMMALGVPEDTRMARLGHSTVQMARHYSRPGEEQDRAAVDGLGRALAGG